MPADRMQQVISMISQAIAGERNDELFYDYLISVAPTEQEKKVIASIRDDERKHRRMFRRLYTQLTGQAPAPGLGEQEEFKRPSSYLEGIEQALMGELKAFENYRTIYLSLPQQYRDTVFEIMTDEIKHASYYNWLYAKNK
jgi:rubrerythrin